MKITRLFIASFVLFFAFSTVSAQMGGNYDIGGGNNDFPDIISGMTALTSQGMNAPVTFNVYSGTYRGQVTIPHSIVGLCEANPLIIQAAPGENPRVVNTGGSGFYINGADYVTIRDMEIDSCSNYGVHIEGYSNADSAKFNTIEGSVITNCGYSTYEYGAGIYLYETKYSQILGNEIQGDYYGIYDHNSSNNITANNMIYGSSEFGIRCNNCTNNSYYYNSVYMNIYYGTNTFACSIYCSANTTLKNNTFFNDSQGYVWNYAIGISGSLETYPIISDYNCLYSPNGGLGYCFGYQGTLELWQSATHLDLHSISAEPRFLSVTEPYNLHIDTNYPNHMNNAGIPLNEITADFDGEMRDAATPDIGADEFTPVEADYNLAIIPASQAGLAGIGGNSGYLFILVNLGNSQDSYILSSYGTNWSTAVFDSAGTTQIDTLLNIAPLEQRYLWVVHYVPAGTALSSSDIGYFFARSVGDSMAVDSAVFTTTAAMSGNYDIGGGANHYPSISSAVNDLNTYGLGDSVFLNVYTGTYRGQVTISYTIPGLDEFNPLAIQAGPGQNPRVVNTNGSSTETGCGFYITGAEYVTIKGMEIDSCTYFGIYIRYGISSTDSAEYITIEGNKITNCGFIYSSGAGIHLYRARYSQVLGNEVQRCRSGIYNTYCTLCMTANNMVYDSDYNGIGCFSSSRHSYYYNSVYMNSQTSPNYAFKIVSSANSTVKNNIFFNDSPPSHSRYAFYIESPLASYPIFSDNNCLYSANGALGYYNDAIYSIERWRSVTNLDLNSINSNPHFVSITAPFNLHIADTLSHINNKGTPVAFVTTDFDGDIRNLSRPDIGADEVTFAGEGDIAGAITGVSDIPASFDLRQNYPNPFNACTTIAFDIPIGCEISLIAYDILGRETAVLVDGYRSAGRYEAVFDGNSISSGIYFVVFTAPGYSMTRKIVLLK